MEVQDDSKKTTYCEAGFHAWVRRIYANIQTHFT